ncbi:hypothetical protein [Erwinia sp. V71]|uniref:hypothetical protein n=1 Tax=Erwinia sp. V71 TaxID=3369424 RepID=UPI003F61F5EF
MAQSGETPQKSEWELSCSHPAANALAKIEESRDSSAFSALLFTLNLSLNVRCLCQRVSE